MFLKIEKISNKISHKNLSGLTFSSMETCPLEYLGTIITAVVVSVVAVVAVQRFFFPYYIPGIPIVKANSLLGFDIMKGTEGRYNSHVHIMKLADEKGKMFQYYWMGYLWVMINDKYLAKFILDNVTGKGYFHVS